MPAARRQRQAGGGSGGKLGKRGLTNQPVGHGRGIGVKGGRHPYGKRSGPTTISAVTLAEQAAEIFGDGDGDDSSDGSMPGAAACLEDSKTINTKLYRR